MGCGSCSRKLAGASKCPPTKSQLDKARREFDEARQQLQAELDAMRQSRQQAHEEIAAVRLELAGVQAEAAAADRAAQRDREESIALWRELDQVRADVQSERQALRAAHTEQIARIQRNADERAAALNQALDLARESAETYRAQLAAQPPMPSRSQRRTANDRPQAPAVLSRPPSDREGGADIECSRLPRRWRRLLRRCRWRWLLRRRRIYGRGRIYRRRRLYRGRRFYRRGRLFRRR